MTAVERAKQITMSELNAVIGVSILLKENSSNCDQFHNFSQQQRDLPRLLQQMHAQQIPGTPPTLPIPMHPSLGAPGQLGGLPSNGPTPPTPQQQLAMLSKQDLMHHSRPDDSGGGGKGGPNDENRHVRHFIYFTEYFFNLLSNSFNREIQYHLVRNIGHEHRSQHPT